MDAVCGGTVVGITARSVVVGEVWGTAVGTVRLRGGAVGCGGAVAAAVASEG